MKQEHTPDFHTLTVAEIARQVGDYNKKRQAITSELAAIYAARKAGIPEAPPLTDHAKSVRARAKALLNGHATTLLALSPDTSREQELRIERDALDLVLAALGRTELIAHAVEGVRWTEEHAAEWKELCRQTTLAKVRLETFERRAAELLQSGGPYVGRLPMTQYVGRPLDGAVASEMADAAVVAGIVTRAEIKKAQEV